jgi:outer membrane lipoprotein-sorting protein
VKKGLLIWNVVLTLVVLAMVISACTTTDSRIPWLVQQSQANSLKIQQLESTVASLQSNVQALQTYINAYIVGH